MERKKTSPRGFGLPQTKLAEHQVCQIVADTRPQKIIAHEFNISVSYVCRLQRMQGRRSWEYSRDKNQ